MADNDKKDYSKVKTHGGVTTTEEGETHPTSLADGGRAAHIQALRNERELLKQRVEGSAGEDVRAKARLADVDKQLDRFGASPRRARKETAVPPKS